MERVKAWRLANPDKEKASRATERERHGDKRRAAARERYRRLMAENPEAIRAPRRNWTKTPKGQRYYRLASHRRRGVKPTPESLTYAEIILADPCCYCGAAGVEIDHVDPVTSGGDGDWTNLTPACRSCNASKNARPLLAYLARSA